MPDGPAEEPEFSHTLAAVTPWAAGYGHAGRVSDASNIHRSIYMPKFGPKAESLPRELPAWWIGNNGSDIVMPKFRVDGYWTPTGKQVEEMIYNCMHNTSYVGHQVYKYFGTTRPNDIMQKWNNDIDCIPVQIQLLNPRLSHRAIHQAGNGSMIMLRLMVFQQFKMTLTGNFRFAPVRVKNLLQLLIKVLL